EGRGARRRGRATRRGLAAGGAAHAPEPATAVTNPPAICPSRGARTPSFMAIDSGLRSDMVVILAVIFASHGGFAQRRQSTLRAYTIAVQHGIKPRVIRSQLRAGDLRVPEVDDAGRGATVLATQPKTQKGDRRVEPRAAPAAEASIDPAAALERGAQNRKIAGARPPPLARS